MDVEIAIKLVLFILLIAFTAFFVATEFAIVKVRTTRIDQLISEGNQKAVRAKTVITHLDEYLSACQLGITITALGLGWVGESTVATLLHPLFELVGLEGKAITVVSFVIAFSVVTFLHVVVGELAPKTLAIQKAEMVTLRFSGPLILFYKIMYLPIRLLNGSARLLARLFGLKMMSENEEVHSEEELRMIMSDSLKGGEINTSEYHYMNRIFEFDDRIAKEVMVPRTELSSFEKSTKIHEIFERMNIEQYTRYPVYDGDKDHIIGVVNMKQILTEMVRDESVRDEEVSKFVQPVIQVIETFPISKLLIKFQMERIHMAILLDEYGGTSGLVTIEDIIEEIVGEIRDEFDADELPEHHKLGEGHYNVSGKLLLDEVNQLLDLDMEDEDVDTIGGWFMANNDDIEVGSQVRYENCVFTATEINNHQIVRLDILKEEPQEETSMDEKEIE
ncbi:hemolysin family protein [Kurthia gibsonii]|uniref:hemolysin family protein n=1 Tax=Kurthia gibsonii TaxID=33946 RepID=UPI002DBBA306|nr:hemolysin family protein [Kurthia gibsonii]MEB7773438.1 hemolysin family protein [Kurthia gibsonii]